MGEISSPLGPIRIGESRRLLPFAIVSAMATATYSITDGVGGRLSGEAAAFVAWALAVTAALYLPISLALKGRAVLRAGRRQWGHGIFAGGSRIWPIRSWSGP